MKTAWKEDPTISLKLRLVAADLHAGETLKQVDALLARVRASLVAEASERDARIASALRALNG